MTASLFDANGQRLYITQSERAAFLEAASRADRTGLSQTERRIVFGA